MTLLRRAFLCGLSLSAALLPTLADDKKEDATAAWLAEHYTKYEHRIPMRDGVKLFTRVYVPKDDTTNQPILLTRTPYALKPYGTDRYNDPNGSFETLARDGFIMVTQDVRGRFASEGAYQHVRPYNPAKGPKDIDESTDAWDTIDWLVKNVPNNNGKVGMLGISYPGFYTSMGMIDSHPALKAASPQAPVTDWFMGDDLHHNGAFFLSQNFDFFYWFETPSDDPLHDNGRNYVSHSHDGYDYFLRLGALGNSDKLFKGAFPAWTEFLSHSTYDVFWKTRNVGPNLKNVHCAVMTVGGWYDAEDLYGALETYRATERQNPGITNMLVMGPWSHGQWSRGDGDKLGDMNFRSKTSPHYQEKLELPFFRHYLKGDTNYTPTEATMFETGTQIWRRFDMWPPKNTQPKTLFFHAGGKLDFTAPTEGADAFDEYVSDPAKPVPFTSEVTMDYPRGYPTHDQRFASARPDVLVYVTEPLEEDLTIAGPLTAALNVSTTGTDSDFVLKLIDVYDEDFPNPEPNPAHLVMAGYQQLVRGDVMRLRFRDGFEKASAVEPGKVTKLGFTLPDILHTFRRGHRVMVQVQSTWFPLVERNPQTYVDNIVYAKPEDYRKATQRVYHAGSAPSALKVLVLPAR